MVPVRAVDMRLAVPMGNSKRFDYFDFAAFDGL
jgi:hypothetical protein